MKLKIEHDDMGYDFWEYQDEIIFISGHIDYSSENTSYCLNDYEGMNELRELYPEHSFEIAAVNAYIHGGIALSLNTFSCPWDSGVFGFLVFPKGTFGEHNIGLAGFVETWSQCLNGEIYGYIIEDSKGNELDSCWGFIGYDCAETEGKSMMKHFKDEEQTEKLNKVKQWIKHRVPLNVRGF